MGPRRLGAQRRHHSSRPHQKWSLKTRHRRRSILRDDSKKISLILGACVCDFSMDMDILARVALWGFTTVTIIGWWVRFVLYKCELWILMYMVHNCVCGLSSDSDAESNRIDVGSYFIFSNKYNIIVIFIAYSRQPLNVYYSTVSV